MKLNFHRICALAAMLSSTIFTGMAQEVTADNNFVLISPGDHAKDIIKKAALLTPSTRQLHWQQLELNAFFHFGINTFTGKEWGDGSESPALFNPTRLDAGQWVRTAKAAGIKQVILTAKHHDGFCLWPSKYTEHSVKNSPWKNGKGDVVKKVADACKKYHMGFGIYLSPWDRNSPLYGTDAYNDYFVNQLKELLTNYGQIDEVWFDGANGEGRNGKKQVYDFDRWYALIRKLQPNAVIAVMGPDVRWVGTETGYGRDTEWSVVPANNLDMNAVSANSQHENNFKPIGDMRGDDIGGRDKIMNAKGLVWYPAETDVSIRPGWFYHADEDDKVKSGAKLMDIYNNSVGKNSELLLNIPPDQRGLISDYDLKSLKAWQKLRKKTFKINLLEGAKVSCLNGLTPRAVLDADYQSYFITAGQDTTSTINFEFKKPKTFDVLLVQENIAVGQRVEKFKLEYWNGEHWAEAVSGTTIGYKRLLYFPAVNTAKVRLVIQASRLNPTISTMGLYIQPQNDL